MEFFRRFDRGWARVEGWLIVLVLLLMVLVAGFQAAIRNLTRWDISWANDLLTDMEWADSLLRKGTLWLAFLGASVATYRHKHIGIDILPRIAPPRAKFVMLAISSIAAGIITIGLTVSFYSAVWLNLTERPIEYELLGDEGSIHVCDATDAQIDQLEDFERPETFCVFRSALGTLSVPAETPGAAFQIIVPLIFLMMSIRLLGRGAGAISVLMGGQSAIDAAMALERAEIQAQQDSVSVAPPASRDPDDPPDDAAQDTAPGAAPATGSPTDKDEGDS